MRKLRVLHVVVQPILVWDDGDELVMGPPIDPQPIPLSKLIEWAEHVPGEVASIEAQIEGPPIEHEPSSNGSEPVATG